MKLFFLVGEDSGDALAASLIRQLKATHPAPIEFYGIGGPLMVAEGFNALIPMEELTTFGILEVLPKIPTLLKIKDAVIAEVEKTKPDAVITVDFPDFNFLVAKALKKRSSYKGKIIHYVAPTVWAWREGRAKKIAKIVDGIMCLFPMEVPYFLKHGLRAECVGHPLVENFVPTPKERSYRVLNNLSDNTIILGLFFGSRETEFKNMGKIITQAAMFIAEAKKNVHVVVPTLPKIEFMVQKELDNLNTPAFVTTEPEFKWVAFQACDVAIAVSGTVGLELAYANVPHLITYKMNPLTFFIIKLLVRVKKAHLVNILLNRDVVPEYIQSEAVAEKIAGEALVLLNNKEKREKMLKDFADMRAFLGANNKATPSKKAADFVLSVVAGKRHIKHPFNDASLRQV